MKQRSLGKRILRLGLRGSGLLLLVCSLHLTVLAFPHPFFPNQVTAGVVTVYTDGETARPLSELATEVDMRLRASRLYDSTQHYDVFLFQSDKRFKFYRSFSLLRGDIQGYALSIFDNAYVNAVRVREIKEVSGGFPRYSITEGSDVHIMAHEVAHLLFSEVFGTRQWKELPLWKREGYPEYVSSIALIRADTTSGLQSRYRILNDDWIWGSGDSHSRRHYEAELLWEYLLDVKGYTIRDVVADSVKLSDVREDLARWSSEQL